MAQVIPPDVAALLTQTFQTYYGHAPSANDLQTWFTVFINNNNSLDIVKSAMAHDPVSQAHISDFVISSYYNYLGRNPTQAELNAWVAGIAGGGDPNGLLAALANQASVSSTSTVQTTAQPAPNPLTSTLFSIGGFNVQGWMLGAAAVLGLVVATQN